jgi:hypothetical protein
MTPRAATLIGMTFLFAVSASAFANRLSESDAKTMPVLFAKVVTMHDDLIETNAILIRTRDFFQSEESRHTWFCLQKIMIDLQSLEPALSPLAYLVGLSAKMENEVDEALALIAVASSLNALTSNIAKTRKSVNSTLVSCRQSPLAYDKAKALMILVDNINQTIAPIMTRVESGSRQGNQ